jgi:DNA-binding transcriptional LysR family regulator
MSRRLPSLTALRAGSLVRVLGKSLAANKAYRLVTPPGRMQLNKVVAFRKWILSQLKRESVRARRE